MSAIAANTGAPRCTASAHRYAPWDASLSPTTTKTTSERKAADQYPSIPAPVVTEADRELVPLDQPPGDQRGHG